MPLSVEIHSGEHCAYSQQDSEGRCKDVPNVLQIHHEQQSLAPECDDCHKCAPKACPSLS
jgi:hypothetical protein